MFGAPPRGSATENNPTLSALTVINASVVTGERTLHVEEHGVLCGVPQAPRLTAKGEKIVCRTARYSVKFRVLNERFGPDFF